MIPNLSRALFRTSLRFSTITVYFKDPPTAEEPQTHKVEAPVGSTLLEVAHENHIDLEGACDGSCACSTCHVIVDPEWFDKLDEAEEDEEDMLDLAYGLTDTSRLACQIEITQELDGLSVSLPSATRNMYVDGYVPEPH